jgi:hypothetical protein
MSCEKGVRAIIDEAESRLANDKDTLYELARGTFSAWQAGLVFAYPDYSSPSS